MKEQDSALKTSDVYSCHGITKVTFYKQISKIGRMVVSNAFRLKAFEEENATLRKLLHELILDSAIRKDVAAKTKPYARRDALALALPTHGVSQWLAWGVPTVDWSSRRYEGIRSDDAGQRGALTGDCVTAVFTERRSDVGGLSLSPLGRRRTNPYWLS